MNDLVEKEERAVSTLDQRPELSNTYTVSGGTNTFVGVVEQQVVLIQDSTSTSICVDNTHCNIFVLKGKNYTGNCFTILKRRAHIDGFNLNSIKSFPSLFIKTNGGYLRCADPKQKFYYGFVKNVEVEGDNYKITYELKSTAPLIQANFIDVALKHKITPISGADILDQTGWRIYPLNIIKALTDNDFDMTIY